MSLSLAALLARLGAAQRLAVSIQTFSGNHHMVDSSRESWRRGVSTVVITNGTTERRIASPVDWEVWYEAPDKPEIGWNNPSENRYTGQVRYANQTFDFDWLLAGDDDTIFLVDNIVNLVRDLDPNDAYYFTDGLLDNTAACTLREEASERGEGDCVKSPPATPCTRAVLSDPSVCPFSPGSEWGIGQSGMLLSRGLINSISEADMRACENCDTDEFCHGANQQKHNCSGNQCFGGGDVRLGECFYLFGANRAGVGPTIPYSHTGVRVFGHPLGDIIGHAERVLRGEHCDESCHFVLDRTISSDIHHATPEEYWRMTHHFSKVYGEAKHLLHGRHSSPLRVDAPPLP